jgi:hypothetical protein
MVRVALGGKGSSIRSMGVRIHTEMGNTGEAIMYELIGPGAEWIGSKRFASWKGAPPIDVVDHNTNVAYQVKTISEPKLGDIAFSGAHKEVVSRKAGGGNIYFGTPEMKVERIQEWVDAHGWTAYKVVMLVDEDTNRVTVYGRPGVSNAGIRAMEPIAGFDNNTGEWFRIPGTPDSLYPPGIPDHAVLLSRFPSVPPYLRSTEAGASTSDAEAQRQIVRMGMFRRDVKVRGHRRRS